MTDHEKYLFDLNGYIVVEGMLTAGQVKALNEAIDHNRDQIRVREGELSLSGGSPALKREHGRGDILGLLVWPKPWRQPFRDLLSHHRTVRAMLELIGNGFRYANANGISMTAGAEGHVFHGGGAPMSHYFYKFQDGKMYNGLMTVCYQLSDIRSGDGGFACIPGSHKANYPCPMEVKRLEVDLGCVRHLPMKVGDALIFTETLTHGTLPWGASHERRTLLYRYSPGPMMFSKISIHPDYGFFADELTPLQRAIMEPPYYSNRPSIAALLEEEETR
jgi:ectoine hydroxylase-related dioxygenase (phytanoyl-CoA dioxygenase family)